MTNTLKNARTLEDVDQVVATHINVQINSTQILMEAAVLADRMHALEFLEGHQPPPQSAGNYADGYFDCIRKLQVRLRGYADTAPPSEDNEKVYGNGQ